MNIKNVAIILCIAATCVGTYFYLHKKTCDSTAGGNRLIVGTSSDLAPFSFMQDGKIVGFDIDLAAEICKRLNKKMELKDMPFDTLIPQLQLGKMHMIAAGLTATPERAERVNFAKPHLVGEPLIVVTLAKNSIQSIKDLDGKEVVVNEGYTADSYASKQKGLIVKRLPNITDAFMALNSGRSYAFITAGNTVKTFFNQYGTEKYATFVIPETSENASLALSKKFPELLNCVQQKLADIESDGTLQALKVKWGLA